MDRGGWCSLVAVQAIEIALLVGVVTILVRQDSVQACRVGDLAICVAK